MPITTTMVSDTTPHTSNRVASLDFLRGLAILGVILVHTTQSVPSQVSAVDSILSLGRFGVQLFYYISAFTMCHMWAQRHGESSPTIKFYIRRFFRIAPLFWIAILVYFPLTGRDWREWESEITLTALFLHGFSPSAINSIVPGGWTIAVEMMFYALFPWLAIKVGDRRHAYLFLALLTWGLYTFVIKAPLSHALEFSSLSSGPVQTREFLYMFFLNQAPIFLLGCYIYHALDSRNAPSRIELSVLIAWFFVSAASSFYTKDAHIGFAAVYLVIGALFYTAVKSGTSLKILEPLGRNSYAIYLIHFIVIDLILRVSPYKQGIPALAATALLVALASYLLSILTDKLIERKVHQRIAAATR